jgi:phosphomannomutase
MKYGGDYFASAVGEVNVVEMMKAKNAVIGGEGNGGIIYPGLHYGRDALVGIAFILSLLAERSMSLSELRASYPDYYISKNKIDLDASLDLESIFKALREKFSNESLNEIDGLKIDFEEGWVHLRKSNTEPIVRVYSESKSEEKSKDLAMQVIDIVKLIQNS